MTPPTNKKQVRSFIGLVNYYRNMWDRRSQLLQPLNTLMSYKVKFKWTDMEQKAFDDIKWAVAHNTLLAYPYFNKRFDIPMVSSDYQIGAVISQEGNPIAFYSSKLTGP